MEPLFRFALVRPPVQDADDARSVHLANDSRFQRKWLEAAASGAPRDARRAVAAGFVEHDGSFIDQPSNTPKAKEIAALGRELDRLEQHAAPTPDHVKAAVMTAFGADPRAVAAQPEFVNACARLRDSIIAIKQLRQLHRLPLEALAQQLRDFEVIARAATDEAFPPSADALRRYRRRGFRLPEVGALSPVTSTLAQTRERAKTLKEVLVARREQVDALIERYRVLSTVAAELMRLGPEHLASTSFEARPSSTASTLALGLEAPLLRPPQRDVVAGDADHADPPRLEARPTTRVPEFRPSSGPDVAFRLKPAALDGLSDLARRTLREANINGVETPLPSIVASIERDLGSTWHELESLAEQPMQRTLRRVGNALVVINTPRPSPVATLARGVIPVDWPTNDWPVHYRWPAVRPSGLADLLVVRQQLVAYESVDVAHIESVLKGERKAREHTRRRETEELTLRESEVTTSEERELESTDRFEMTRETSNTIKEDAAMKAGMTVSGKYGPFVEFSASAEGSYSMSRQEAVKSASTFAQDVSQRSAHKITERVLERASLRVTNEVIEKNEHELNNVGGAGHVSGVYQWVNKVYQAQMFNYGLRTMFDFMVPEPAAFLIEAMASTHAAMVELTQPIPFSLNPTSVTETNYAKWVSEYGATDVNPPPEPFRTKSYHFGVGNAEAHKNFTNTAAIAIDDGYQAIEASVGSGFNLSHGLACVDVCVGRRPMRFDYRHNFVWVTPLDNERDSLPFTLKTWEVTDVVVSVEVLTKRTDRAMLKWRLETHAKLMTAYRARLSEYEEKLATLQVQAGIAISGRNPGLNLELVRDELKKACLTIVTEQHFDAFGAIETCPTNGLPQLDLAQTPNEGAFVRFFEQAFEWEHMTWITYPYFWGRKDKWVDRIGFDDADPAFNQLLKAGFCRVSVPARPGFEGAIDHFLMWGELWDGGPLPTISSPLFLPIADEIAERLGRPGDEQPEGKPWPVRLPTTLVHLRADDKLPKWKQDAATGEWVEA